MTDFSMEKEEIEKKPEAGGHLSCKRDQVAWPSKQAVPPESVWASVVDFTSPSVYILIYPKNLHCLRDGAFCKPERYRHHDLHF
jgi:hypothetical protein